MDVTEAQLAVAPEATPEATPEPDPEVEVETQSDQGASDAGKASNLPAEIRGRDKARRIPTKVFLANAMEEIRKLDFTK